MNHPPNGTAALVSFLFYKALLAVFLKWTNLTHSLLGSCSLSLYSGSLEGVYIADVGQNADLPCTYTPNPSEDPVPVCWGRGACPVFECHSMVLSTDGRNLKYQTSNRYQLKRTIHKGDVSLTIENVTLADSGIYCCRIQFPGPMNDKKLNLELVIKPGEWTFASLLE